MTSEEQQTAARVRAGSGVVLDDDGGPDDAHIVAGVRGFVEAFDYWYIRFLEEKAIPQYRTNIVARINPFIRRIDCDGLSAEQTAERIVGTYAERNFVTAGGWALEEMAARAGLGVQKSPAEGIDLQRYDPANNDHHLYVVKSGPITRNSDILSALKTNARHAEGRLRQAQGTAAVTANYATAFGTLKTTIKDGVRRPSSGMFWSEILDLREDKAIDLAVAMVAEAASVMRHSEASDHLRALELLVADYIARRDDDGVVDWEFIAKRNMQDRSAWKREDEERHTRAKARLTESGYGHEIASAGTRDDQDSEVPPTDLGP
jgi:Type II restriction endonuclease EcoO109I